MQKLLDEYKKYDYLNQKSGHPLVKIFVSYIKPSFLFKSEILTPIHLGRAVAKENSKEGAITDDDLKWLYENCIGDDDFEGNISNINRRVGFLTGTYRAWKNYEKLGNPEYFGSFGYRRLLDSNCLDDILNFDFIIPKLRTLDYQKIKTRMDYYGSNLYDSMMNAVTKVCPNDYSDIEKYFKRTFGFYDEIYIFKKELFFGFCEWIFPIVFELLKINEKEFSFSCDDKSVLKYFKEQKNEKRDIAYIVERLTGYYILKLTKNKNYKYKKVKTILYTKQDNATKIKMQRLFINALRQKVSVENALKTKSAQSRG